MEKPSTIPNNSFVFTLALMCHGSILGENTSFSHNSRLIAYKNIKMGCPIHFNGIDIILQKIHNEYNKDLHDTTTQDIISKHESLTSYPLLFEKLLFFNPNTLLEKFNSIFGIKNKHEDGIYLISIHKKTDKGLEKLHIETPINLMLVNSWNVLSEQKMDEHIYSLNTKKSLTEKFYNINEEKHIKKIQFNNSYNRSKSVKSIENLLDNATLELKKGEVKNFNLHMEGGLEETEDKKINNGRIIEIKLSAVLNLLKKLNPNTELSSLSSESDTMNFFNIYDYTCNNFASSVSENEIETITEEYKLKSPFQISYNYGGKFSKRGGLRHTRKRKQ
jgi:hypothetical protein